MKYDTKFWRNYELTDTKSRTHETPTDIITIISKDYNNKLSIFN